MMSRRRRRNIELGASLVDVARDNLAAEHVDTTRRRLHGYLDGPLAVPAMLASVDQYAMALARRLRECGLDPHDPTTRAALLVITDSFTASLAPHAGVCTTSVRMWSITSQIGSAVLALDTDPEGARP